VRLSVPYQLWHYDGWVVEAYEPGKGEGRVLLTT